jgi:hypothetical protein
MSKAKVQVILPSGEGGVTHEGGCCGDENGTFTGERMLVRW